MRDVALVCNTLALNARAVALVRFSVALLAIVVEIVRGNTFRR